MLMLNSRRLSLPPSCPLVLLMESSPCTKIPRKGSYSICRGLCHPTPNHPMPLTPTLVFLSGLSSLGDGCSDEYHFFLHRPSSLSLFIVPIDMPRMDERRNELQHLPEGVGRLHALRFLSAHSNSLEDLPSDVGGLVSLQFCDLSGNR